MLEGHGFVISSFCYLGQTLLEFSCQVCSLSYSVLVNKIERVQRKFTKRMRGLSRFTYTEILHRSGADSVKLRRLKLDMISTFRAGQGE